MDKDTAQRIAFLGSEPKRPWHRQAMNTAVATVLTLGWAWLMRRAKSRKDEYWIWDGINQKEEEFCYRPFLSCKLARTRLSLWLLCWPGQVVLFSSRAVAGCKCGCRKDWMKPNRIVGLVTCLLEATTKLGHWNSIALDRTVSPLPVTKFNKSPK